MKLLVIMLFFGGFPNCIYSANFSTDSEQDKVIEQRIIGGHDTTIEEYPFVVSIALRNVPLCGGSIIEANKVLTAAFCCKDFDAEEMSVTYGSTTLKPEGTKLGVRKFLVYPGYSEIRKSGNICIITLDSNIKFNKKARRIEVDDSFLDAAGPYVLDSLIPFGLDKLALRYRGKPVLDDGVMLGWGYKAKDKEKSNNKLQAVDLDIIPRIRCNELYTEKMHNVFIYEDMFCGGRKVKMGGCYHDIGNPFIAVFNGKPILIGVYSFGDACANTVPDVFARVSFFKQWIEKHA